MLEILITQPSPSGPGPVEPDYPYNSDTMFRVIKEPVAMTLTYSLGGSSFTIHYGDQNAASSGTLVTSAQTNTFSIPANVTEFFLKQVTPGVRLTSALVAGPNITEVTWNPELKTTQMYFYPSPKLTDVSAYLPQEITDLSSMFYSCTTFNGDISNWDTSNITTMGYMFYNCTAFNGDISSWNTSNVTTMSSMFTGASTFNQDIGDWNTEKLTSMQAFLQNASAFNQNLSKWNVSKVINRINYDAGATAWQADFKPRFI